MNETFRNQVLASFELTPDQQKAAVTRGQDVVVTAGAGSGKTSTLVARFASLLADGMDLRRVIAVTFSDKAAREMRSRVRKTLSDLAEKAAADEERQFWLELNAKMDSARIGTIHGLCAEILRAHPAEAVIDPRFTVYDEGLTAALRVQIIEDTKAKLAGMQEFEPLFSVFQIGNLTSLLSYLLNKRLEAREAFEKEFDAGKAVQIGLESLLQIPAIANCIYELKRIKGTPVFVDAGEKFVVQVEELLALWTDAEKALAMGDVFTCVRNLYQIRREKMDLRIGKRDSRVKQIVSALKTAYDESINPVCGGKNKQDTLPDANSEASSMEVLNLVRSAFYLLEASYKDALRQLGSLDFDDLESGAAQLLRNPAIQEFWQGQIDALLVDEFQDTNQRQRDIVEALAGSAGKLFVVGDAKQSIYRFRQADVTVFRTIRQDIRKRGGLPINLNLTFRAHRSLLLGMNDLLREVMGEEEDPSRPYYEPFSPLEAFYEEPRQGIAEPHLEFVIGFGEQTDIARPAAAQALACRLLELKQQGQITQWDDVALLFRAGTGFPAYESAFEEANIPFVTVAGQGFYDRPEIRDILNILRALTDPTDNLAMAGLLRSPAFGLTDTALYQLRWKVEKAVNYWAALHDDLSTLSPDDQQHALRSVAILEELKPQIDRIPVSDLLRKLVNLTDYRAVLAIEDQKGSSGRLWRNLDKLIEDAQASGKVVVRDFLDYLTTINDAGAREGEAPAEAQGSIRLMTIHKAKGLQFPVVVLADAGRRPRVRTEIAYLLQDLGLSFKIDPEPILFRLAKALEKRQSGVEEQRILYVALTRAQQKLIINGHVTPTEKLGWSPTGWLNDLMRAAQMDANNLFDSAGNEVITHTSSGAPVRGWTPAPDGLVGKDRRINNEIPPDLDALPIYAPLVEKETPMALIEEPEERHDWRATGASDKIPPKVVGNMVHKAIELWLFPGDPHFLSLLETAALDAGLALISQRETAVKEAASLLARLHKHPLWQEIESAAEIYHELPYSRMIGGNAETGYLDLLYRSQDGWQIVDFKTDMIRSDVYREGLIQQYTRQMCRYAGVMDALLGQSAQTRICFLDDQGKVSLVNVANKTS